jgi:uncharacterized RDD family membrane protein YckC
MFCTHCGRENPDTAQFCFACGRPLSLIGPSSPPAVAQTPARYAGFWIRFAALIIDTLVLTGASLIAAIPVGVLTILGSDDFAVNGTVAGYYLVSFVGSWLYSAFLESSAMQATLGKRAVGIVVTDTRGRRLSFGRATGRFFAKFLNSFTLGIGWILAGVTAQKRGLHDFAAGTLVVFGTRDARTSVSGDSTLPTTAEQSS